MEFMEEKEKAKRLLTFSEIVISLIIQSVTVCVVLIYQ